MFSHVKSRQRPPPACRASEKVLQAKRQTTRGVGVRTRSKTPARAGSERGGYVPPRHGVVRSASFTSDPADAGSAPQVLRFTPAEAVRACFI